MLRSGRDGRNREVSKKSAWRDDPSDLSRTVQSEKDNCDINVIVRRFGVTGMMPPPVRVPEYGDYTGVNDFHSAMNSVRQAKEDFLQLPANVRKRFSNDPQLFLEFCSDPENLDEMVKLGLAVPRETLDNVDASAAKVAADKLKEKADVKRDKRDGGRVDRSKEARGESGKDSEGE